MSGVKTPDLEPWAFAEVRDDFLIFRKLGVGLSKLEQEVDSRTRLDGRTLRIPLADEVGATLGKVGTPFLFFLPSGVTVTGGLKFIGFP